MEAVGTGWFSHHNNGLDVRILWGLDPGFQGGALSSGGGPVYPCSFPQALREPGARAGGRLVQACWKE